MPDLVSIFVNLSHSLAPIQKLLTGFGYLIGVAFILLSLQRFHKIGDSRATSGSQEKMFVPALYFIIGVALIFLPSSFDVLANTAFGSSNVLAYESDTGNPLMDAIDFLIKTTGVLWFIRGSVLLAQASEPGVQEGPKGLAFLVAGVFAINFDNTVQSVDFAMNLFFTHMDTLKQNATGP